MELAIEAVSKSFGGIRALDDVTLHARAGSVTGIIGPNGSGKSTLFNVISGALRPDGGRVELDGTDITGRPTHELARAGLVRTFQVPRVARRLTVLDNLAFAASSHEDEGLLSAMFSTRRRRQRERLALEHARHVAEVTGLHTKVRDYAGQLSGGQLKLLSLGMAMLARPKVLLLDEPTAGVNPALIDVLVAPVFDGRPEGQTILIIEHNMQLVGERCEEVYVLDAGRVISRGPPELVRSDDRVISAYLGYEAAAG